MSKREEIYPEGKRDAVAGLGELLPESFGYKEPRKGRKGLFSVSFSVTKFQAVKKPSPKFQGRCLPVTT